MTLAFASSKDAPAARTYGGYYTQERLANARENCRKYDWAQRRRDEAKSAAARWVSKSDEELWRMVPGQDLPRCIDISLDTLTTGTRRTGCLKCGDTYYNWAQYLEDEKFDKKPWKVICPACGAVFPTNDFPKYYESAIDEHGLFNPAKGDRSLLFNTEHPDPKDPLHKYGVDDGFGYVDAEGRSHKYVAVYAWRYWRQIMSAVRTLAEAYLCTGDRIYAHKAAVLLDRIADVYPSMDWAPYAKLGWYHSDGGNKIGKIEGRIWECGIISGVVDSYELTLSGTEGDDELGAFLKRMSDKYKLPTAKGTRELYVQNCDDNIIRCAAKAMMSEQVYGNEGMHQSAMAVFASALNTNPDSERWLDWIFDPRGGAIPGLIVDKMDRDGVGPEAAPHYALMWSGQFANIANRMADYGVYKKHDIHRDLSQFHASFASPWNLSVLGLSTPNLGDTGACGMISRVSLHPLIMARAFQDTGDEALGVATYRANGNSAVGLGRDIMSADPDNVAKRIDKLGKAAGPRPRGGSNYSGFGLATLESGEGTPATGLACNYGRTEWHGHYDQLNFDLLAFGTWLAPDHGNPEYKTDWPSRNEWTVNTLSHNTVVVNQKPQTQNYTGRSRFYTQMPGFGAFELACPAAYPSTKEYARTMAMVDTPDGNSYVVDIFRVEGGNDHLMSFHGPPGKVEAKGLNLETQTTGTYAGPNIRVGALAKTGFPMGYSYLYNVRRDAAPGSAFQVDYQAEPGYRGIKAKDDVHLRYHGLTSCSDVALADGDPPQNQPGNPKRLGYTLMHRKGQNLASTFVAVIEPYKKTPFIKSVERLGDSTAESTQAVLRITLADGSVDTILWNQRSDGALSSGNTSLSGKLGFVRSKGDKVTSAVLVQGSELKCGAQVLQAPATYTGKVVRMNRKLDGGGWVWLKGNLPSPEKLVGLELTVDTTSNRNACYKIHSAEKDGDLVKANCGPITFVRGYSGDTISMRSQTLPADYSHGYLYDFEEGATFTIPNHASF